MGLSDIDEDDGPVVPPPPKQQQVQGGNASPTATSAAGAGAGAGKAGIDLDDLFSGMGVASSTTGSGAAAPSPAAARTAPAPSNDVLDSLFAASPVSDVNASPSSTGSPNSFSAQAQSNTNVLYVDGSTSASPDDGTNLLDTSRPSEKQKFTTAESLLEAFSRQGKKGSSTRFAAKDSLDQLTKNKDDNKVRARLLALMDYYDVLGVAHTASQEEIKRSYKKKALELHPDRVGRDQTSEEAELFKTITKAHEVLTDPEKKAEYDRQLQGGGSGMGYPTDSTGAGGAADWLSHWQRPSP